jgi:hypothetical protein
LDIEKLKNRTQLEIIEAFRLSNNYAPHVKNIYVVTFADKSVRLYDNDKDTLSNSIFNLFKSNSQICLGLKNEKWYIYTDNWKLKASLNKSQFDSINIIDFDHFIGYKNEKQYLFYFKDSSDSLVGFNEIKFSVTSIPVYYENGIFVTIASKDNNINGKVIYLDFETGLIKSTLRADSILNYPNPFVEFSIIRQGKTYSVYSFISEQTVEDSFNKHYVVPFYFYPLILKDDYIGLGDHKDWKHIRISSVASVEFEIYGDLVIGILTTKKGDRHYVDLWEKKIISKKNYQRLTAS